MRRLTLALALAALGAVATLAHTRPALASDSPTLSAGDGTTSAMCSEGHTVECYRIVTYKCLSWSYVPDLATGGSWVCTQSYTITQIVYRD